ncbi:MAG: bifunctional oligoribonuclease/PAP phosphatase NrnA [Bacilli bacterium]|nr:bifunctional oligoribonuclease/PAP phosphatase NrnA [Bacilli bacterium]MDD3305376.1 bifunctional oligoribonuclease/PAP phosphatase NrnA [Bacilli bacterium]MDD4053429.1 bifunctional oligoribonuclease/PAP phosphatase NrnA [Bacilli bacterium]MDD4410924.1 bifunctional oligoribonuclease/PAP phosphatase NrnA [Bacilli bacterium]
MHRKIFNKIKKYNTIVIARHIGPDPDALGSEIGLRDIITHTFPHKKVYAVGAPTAKFKFIGALDKLTEEIELKDALLIVLDTPDKRRIDGVDVSLFKESIKIDHHPFIEKVCDIEWIDETSSSACQMIIELCLKTKLEFSKYGAERLFIGLVADTNRFLFNSGNESTVKIFDLTRYLLSESKIDVTPLYADLYMRSINEMKLQGYVSQNMVVTDNGVGYVKLTDETIKEFNVDAASAGNMVNNFNFIDGVLVWLMISEDVKQKIIRINIRSRGPVINLIAEEYNGGGHKFASGARVSSYEEAYQIIEKLDEACKKYKENKKGGKEDEDK